MTINTRRPSLRNSDCKQLTIIASVFVWLAIVARFTTASEDYFESVPFKGIVAASFRSAKTPILSISWRPNGSSFAVTPKSAKVVDIWLVNTSGKNKKLQISLQCTVQRNGMTPMCMAWSPDGSVLAVGFANGNHGSLSVFRIPDDSRLAKSEFHSRDIVPYWSANDFLHPIHSLGFMSDVVLLTPDRDGNSKTVNLWKVGHSQSQNVHPWDSAKKREFSVTNGQVVSIDEQRVILYQTRDAEFVETWRSPSPGLTRCAISNDGRYVMASSAFLGNRDDLDSGALTAHCWDTTTPSAKPIALDFRNPLSVVARRQEIQCLAFGPSSLCFVGTRPFFSKVRAQGAVTMFDLKERERSSIAVRTDVTVIAVNEDAVVVGHDDGYISYLDISLTTEEEAGHPKNMKE
ncbi:MAG: hypothetical protein NT069_31345 [Planctomycetota bacterium]|nr:hypothetical protein [Planctomycetota bacterium]